MFKKKLFVAASLLIALSMILAACTPQTVEVIKTVEVEKEVEKEVIKTVEVVTEKETIVEVTPTVVPSTRKGGWLDMVVIIEEPNADAAISRMEAGDIDAYFYTVARADILKTIEEGDTLTVHRSYGSYNELTLNPVGPTFEATGTLNPFSNPKIREAINWLIDRDYIANEVTQGMAIPRFFSFSPAFAEASRYADLVAQWESYYAYNKDKATEVITAEMEAMGATLVDNKWQFNDEPVTLIYLIRTEDERRQIGDYVANELDSIGFASERKYAPSAELSPIWTGNPNDGLWHLYTGGWVTTVVPRTEEDNFIDFYAPEGWPGNPLWDAYTNDAAFHEAGMKLYYREYTTLEERRELFATLIPASMKESQRVWTTNRASFTPYRTDVSVTGDLAGGVYTTPMWALTLRRAGEEGGAMTVAMPSILTNPWNPTNGSNWAYDMSVIRATQAYGTFSDPWTGLAVPQRIEKAEVTAQADLPIGQSSASASWLTFSQADTIEVPADAWIDWNAETETFITVGEAYTETLTAAIKSVVTYPADLWDVTWHDGTPINIADFVMPTLLTFDRAAEGISDVFDPAAATSLRSFKGTFKGFKIVSEDPLVIEYYTDNWQPDAENNVVSMWPNYAYGTGSWYSMAVGLRAEASGETAFSQAKAGTIEKEWLSYLSGPTVELLKTQLDASVAENYVPYAATLGKWVTADVATAAWANYAEWFRQRGHFWVGTGPYYVERAFPVEGMVVLKHYAGFPDMADRWSGYGVPKVAVVDVTAPASVTVGKEAEFEVDITFEGEPYPADGIDAVNWLLFAADGSVAAQGAAEAAGEGFYTITVSADDAAKLTAGSSKLLVVVVSNIVSIPAFGSVEFPVTAP